MNNFLHIVYYLIFMYIIISFIEWFLHHYFMHANGSLESILKTFNINIKNSHIDHHKETRIDQSVPHNCTEEGLVFDIMNNEILIILLLILLSSYLFWLLFPNFKKSFSLLFILIITFIISISYTYIWNSIHTTYHKHYININKPLKNNSNMTIYSPLHFFIPDQKSNIYKYLYWYHTLHHLNKSKEKCNYNIICPLFDFIIGTYKSKVDNTKYFSTHKPENKREKWLKKHIEFEIRIRENIEYRDKDSNVWKRLPHI